MLLLLLAAFVLAGCETGTREIKAEPDPRIDTLAAENAKLSKRLDELARVVLDIQDAQRRQAATRESPAASGQKAAVQEKIKVEDIAPPVAPVKEPAKVEEEKPSSEVEAKESGAVTVDNSVPAGTDPASVLFRRAYNAYREGSLGRAMLDFEEFTTKYPKHEYADDAQFTLGEIFFSDGKFAEALVEFNKVVQRYATEPKAPEALYMIGECYARLGQKDNAKASYVRLLSEYPASEAAYRAKQKLDNP